MWFVVILAFHALPIATRAEEQPAAPGQPIREFYLLLGQSNMAGRGKYVEAEDMNMFSAGTLFVLDDKDVFSPIGPYPFINHHSTIRKSAALISPGVMFAKMLLEAEPGSPVYLVSNARGGTSIKEWAKGGHFYAEAVRRSRAAALSASLAGILWHQGETDYRELVKLPSAAEQARALEEYMSLLKRFITDLRSDLGAADVPFIAGQLNRDCGPFNERLLELPREIPDVFVVRSDGLTTSDGTHFDRDSVLQLGRRYGRELLRARRPAHGE